MEENTFWLAIWRTVAAAIFGIVAAVAGCSTVADYQVKELVISGVNPIAARCAIWGSGERNSVACFEVIKFGGNK